MPQIYYSTNNVSVRTRYVKGSSTAEVSDKTQYGTCAAKTARWIANMQKIGANSGYNDLFKTDPEGDGSIAIVQSLFGMKYDQKREEDSCIMWLARRFEWTVERGFEQPGNAAIQTIANPHNVPSEWLVVTELPPPGGGRHAIGIATRMINGELVFFIYDPNRGMYSFDERMANMNLGFWYPSNPWKLYRNNVNDD